MAATLSVYVNGALHSAPMAPVSALDRGFTLGDGLFETMRWRGGQVFRLADHLARLRRSAAVLDLPVPLDDVSLEQAIVATVRANGLSEAVVRLTLTRGVPAQRGLLPPATAEPTLVIHAMPFVTFPADKYRQGFRAHLSRIRRNETSPASGIKSCNYLDNVLARMEAAAAGADEALLLNLAGYLAGGASSNAFAVRGGTVITPAAGSGALMGITRGVVRELAPARSLAWEERPLELAELAGADEAFLTNAVMGIMPLTRLEGRVVGTGQPGPVTLALADAYQELLDRRA